MDALIRYGLTVLHILVALVTAGGALFVLLRAQAEEWRGAGPPLLCAGILIEVLGSMASSLSPHLSITNAMFYAGLTLVSLAGGGLLLVGLAVLQVPRPDPGVG